MLVLPAQVPAQVPAQGPAQAINQFFTLTKQ